MDIWLPLQHSIKNYHLIISFKYLESFLNTWDFLNELKNNWFDDFTEKDVVEIKNSLNYA